MLSTHIDCVPPFFASRVADGVLYGRGACDAKGALAAQVVAAERLREAGEEKVGLLFVVGEERGSDGAIAANELAPGARFLVNGEPTGSRLGLATRGVLRVKLVATRPRRALVAAGAGRERDRRLIDALVELRRIPLPEDARARPDLLLDRPDLGRHRPERDLPVRGGGAAVPDRGPRQGRARRAWRRCGRASRSSSCSRSRR